MSGDTSLHNDTDQLLTPTDYAIELTTHYPTGGNAQHTHTYDDVDLKSDSTNKYDKQHTNATVIDVQAVSADIAVVGPAPLIVRLIESIHPRAHYGHFAIPLCSLIIVLANAGTTLGMGYYSDYLMADLNISRSLVSGCWAAALLTSSVFIPMIGRSFDKFGARMTVMCSIPFYVLAFFLFSQVHNIYMMILVFFMFRVFKSVFQMYSSYVINQWFVHNKGIAMTLYQCLSTFGLGYPILLSYVERIMGGWRQQLMVMGVLHGVLCVVLCSMGINNPERIGRLPDLKRHDAVSTQNTTTDNANGSSTPHVEEEEEIHWAYADAIRTPLFWTVVIASLSTACCWSGYNFNYKSMWAKQGVTEDVEQLFALIAVFNTISLAVAGVVFDRIHNKGRGMAIGTVTCFAAVLLLKTSHTYTGAQWFAVAMGFQDGIFQTGYLIIFAYSFGRVDLGTIDSLAGACVNMVVGFAPFLCGVVEDLYGSFDSVYYGLMCLSAVTTVSLAFSKKPTPPPVERRLSLLTPQTTAA